MSALPMPEQGLLGMPSFDMSEDEKKQALNMGLLAAGAGILAGNRGNYGRAGPAIGQGLLAGMQTYQGMNQQARQGKRQAYSDQMQAEQFRMKQEEMKRQQEQRARMDGLLGGQGSAPGTAQTEIMGIPIEKARQIYAMGGPEALQKAATEAYTLGDTRYVGASPLVTAQAKPQLVETADPNEPLRTVKQWMRPGETQGVQIGTGTMPEILDPRVQRAKQTIARAGAGQTTIINEGQKGFDNEIKLRGDFRSEPVYKAHQEMKSAYSQIRQALGQASPAGDLAGATKIMKLLDPGSVVRESELGMAMAASGLIDRVTNYADMIRTGQKLTPTQRIDFQNLADKLFQESVTQYNAKGNEYRGIAKEYGFNEDRVAGPLDNFTAPAPAEKPPLSSFENKPR